MSVSISGAGSISGLDQGFNVTSGNVKIGTTTEGQSEADDLTIATSAHTGMTIRSGTTSKGAVYFSDGTSGDSEYRGVLEYNHSDDHFRIFTAAGERLRIESNGKVGINTASPRAVLDIEGNAENFTLFLHSNDANANLQFSDNSGGARILNYGGDLAFRTGTNPHSFGAGDSEALRITSDNKLGINITNPTRQLEIYNSSHATAALQSDTQSSLFFSDPSDTNVGQISYMHSDNYMYFRVNDAERLRIGSDGHLSYKNSSPPAWSTDSGYANATLGSSAYFRTDTDPNSNFLSIGCNAYRGSSTWQHVNSGYATQLQQSANDGHLTYNTSTTNGSAGNSITWNEVIRITRSEVGIGGVPSAGDGATYNNWSVPKLFVRGNSDANKFHLVGRFRAGNDSDNTGAQIVIHHENDRGMALQGGRSASNRSYGAIKSLDNLAREATVMDFRGDNGQGVDYIKFYTGSSNSTTEQFKIDSSGRVYMPNQPRFFAWGNSSINMTTTGYHTWATFNNTRFNIGNNFSTSTKLFTAPVNGTYAFGCNCRIDAGGVGYFRIILSINGSSADNDQGHSIRNADAANAFYHSQEVTALYQLSANDNVRVIVEANSDSSWTMQSESQFWGYLVA